MSQIRNFTLDTRLDVQDDAASIENSTGDLRSDDLQGFATSWNRTAFAGFTRFYHVIVDFNMTSDNHEIWEAMPINQYRRLTQLGKAVASRRKLLHLTREDLARSMGVLIEWIETLENGDCFRGQISEEVILSLAKCLKASPQAFRILADIDDAQLGL